MREEFTSHDVLQDHVDVARVVERAKHVHDEWMLQLGQNPNDALGAGQAESQGSVVKPHDFHRWSWCAPGLLPSIYGDMV